MKPSAYNSRSAVSFSRYLVCALALSLSAGVLAQTKLAYVDMKMLLDNAPQIAASREQLDREYRPQYEDLQLREEELRALRGRLERDDSVLETPERQQLEREIRGLSREITRDREDLQEELQYRANQEMLAVQDRIYAIVRDYAERNSFDLVLPGPVLYASEATDITGDILERVQAEFATP